MGEYWTPEAGDFWFAITTHVPRGSRLQKSLVLVKVKKEAKRKAFSSDSVFVGDELWSGR